MKKIKSQQQYKEFTDEPPNQNMVISPSKSNFDSTHIYSPTSNTRANLNSFAQTTYLLKPDNPAQKVEGLFYALTAILCHMWVLPCLKELYAHNTDLTGFEVMYWKSLGNFICLTVYSLFTENDFRLINPYLIQEYRGVMFLRVLLGFLNYAG